MAITFPKTWVSGEELKAADTLNNLDAMKKKAQKLSSADIVSNTPWFNTHHIMQPSYNAVTNIVDAVSGVYGGRNNGGGFLNMSYVTRWMSQRSGSSTNAQKVFVPLSCIELNLTAPCSIFFQWHMNIMTAKDGDGVDGSTHFFAYSRSGTIPDSFAHKFPEQLNASNNDTTLDGSHQSNGFNFISAVGSTGTENLNYGIGLQARSNAGRCVQIAWSVSVECFYM
jgi:hypothetical protein